MRSLLAILALSVGACGGHTMAEEPSGGSGSTGGGSAAGNSGVGGNVGVAGAAGVSAGGSAGSGGQVSGLAGLDQVCGPFLASVTAASPDPGCAACIDGASNGACSVELAATKSSQGPCSVPNQCGNDQCKCEGRSCPPTWCSCLHGCLGTAPDSCSDAWSTALACLAQVCAKAC